MFLDMDLKKIRRITRSERCIIRVAHVGIFMTTVSKVWISSLQGVSSFVRSVFTILKLTFPWDTGGLSLDGILKREMELMSMV